VTEHVEPELGGAVRFRFGLGQLHGGPAVALAPLLFVDLEVPHPPGGGGDRVTGPDPQHPDGPALVVDDA